MLLGLLSPCPLRPWVLQIGRPMYPEYLAGQEEAIAEQAAFNLQQQQQRQEQQNLNSKWQPGPAAMPPPPTRQTPQQQQRARPQNQGKRRGQAQVRAPFLSSTE